ncbi:MAG: methionyl-tRNA formyltransferase [Planctomycetota bacterium]|jgi:methionyl-tRNA formyltransferase
MRLCFLGSPPFATPVLDRLISSRFIPGLVVTPPDRPVGRRRQIEKNPLAALAEERGVSVLQPPTVRDESFLQELRAFDPEVILVVAYGEYLTTEFREIATQEILNVHPSLLPRHRGASPIQSAIAAGDEVTGVSLQRVVKEMDAGDLVHAIETELGAEETAGELSERLTVIAGEAALAAIEKVADGSAVFEPQDESRVTTCTKLSKLDGVIDWTRSATNIRNCVRAMNPWPLARTRLPNGKDLLVLEARVSDLETSGAGSGTVIEVNNGLRIETGDGVLELVTVKREGKGALPAVEFVRGARLESGMRLGESAEGAKS